MGLKPHQLRPQDVGEISLDSLQPGKAYLPEHIPPYHLDMQVKVSNSFCKKTVAWGHEQVNHLLGDLPVDKRDIEVKAFVMKTKF